MEEVEQLRARVSELEVAIRHVVTLEGDDLCWIDVYSMLAKLIGLEFNPCLLGTEKFLANCARFEESLRTGRPYKTEV